MINRHNAPWTLADAPTLDWQPEGPRSTVFDDVYYARQGGAAEGEHVFLAGSEIRQKIAALKPGQHLAVAEVGFGTGFNFLLTAQAWLAAPPTGARLHYVGIDAFPLRRSELERALPTDPALAPLAQQLLKQWPAATRGVHRQRWPSWNLTLDLWWEDAETALGDMASHNRPMFDVWYLDGFAPARCGAMWSDRLLGLTTPLSREGATVATFSAAGHVRRGLQSAGFSMHKRPGFGSKRECLAGHLREPPQNELPASLQLTPWDLCGPTDAPADATVVGAGLGGAHMARALAERGTRVRVCDRVGPGSGGSSNLQGLTYTRLSRRASPLADFALASYGYATRLYGNLLGHGLQPDIDGAQCGFLQVGIDDPSSDYFSQVLSDDGAPARIVNPSDASECLGTAINQGGVFFPEALWLHPPAVCRERLDHPNIRIETGVSVSAGDTDGVTVFATAGDLRQHDDCGWLPLQVIRGQVTHVPETPASQQLRAALCHEGYLPPARQGQHCLGASYGPNDERLDERPGDHMDNLTKLAQHLPGLNFPERAENVSGHVALRCTTADYLPVAGPMPDSARFNSLYADLSRQKTRLVPIPCPQSGQQWMLAGLGSRGLTAAPLAAEMIASELFGEPPPAPRYLHRAVSPARFLARGLIRNQPL